MVDRNRHASYWFEQAPPPVASAVLTTFHGSLCRFSPAISSSQVNCGNLLALMPQLPADCEPRLVVNCPLRRGQCP